MLVGILGRCGAGVRAIPTRFRKPNSSALPVIVLRNQRTTRVWIPGLPVDAQRDQIADSQRRRRRRDLAAGVTPRRLVQDLA